MMEFLDITITIQGWFYVVTGIWPLIHMHSFEKVSGYKHDKWLVKTVGLLIACSGIIFLMEGAHPIALQLAILNALALMMIDLYYVARKIIRKVYLLDALVESVFIAIYLLK